MFKRYEDCLGKTDPELSLIAHTEDVVDEVRRLLEIGYTSKYKSRTGEDLERQLIDTAWLHDAGKTTNRWQSHAEKNCLQKVGMRHEIASVLIARKLDQFLWPSQEAAILAHHGKLSENTKDRFEDAEEFKGVWDRMKRLEHQAGGFEDALQKRYKFSTIRGLLSIADRRASEKEAGGDPAAVEPFEYEFPYDSKRPVQNLAQKLPEIAALRAETGSGKTAASLLWAKAHNANRVIFAMPTRFTATSLAEDVGGGLYHSSARDKISLARLQAGDRFLSPITVTTIDQVLMALTGRTEKQHMRFANLADSVVVMDEIDAYDEFMQGNIQVLSEALATIDVPHLAMSATLPSSFVEDLLHGNVDLEDATGRGGTFQIDSLEEVGKTETPLPDEAETADKVIVYANTTDRAVSYYQSIDREDKILYHSKFTRPHRSEIEQEILRMLSEDGDGGVVVMTQVGEMSLNVTCDIMVSDLCPVDRLAQRTGRMKRFCEEHGTLYLIYPQDYPAPYGEFHLGSNEWTESPAWTKTAELVSEGDRLSKNDLKEMSEQVYAGGISLGVSAKQNAGLLKEDEVEGNWLIQPADGSDETSQGQWKTRNIQGRTTVIIGEPPSEMNWAERWKLDLNKGVSVMQHKADNAQQKSVTVGGEAKQLYWTDQYNRELGIRL